MSARKQLTRRDLGYGIEKLDLIDDVEVSYGTDMLEQYRLAEEIHRNVTPSEYKVFVYLNRSKETLEIVEKRSIKKDHKFVFNLKDMSTPNLEFLRKVFHCLVEEKVKMIGIKLAGGSILKSIKVGEVYYKKYWDIMTNTPRILEVQMKRGKRAGSIVFGLACIVGVFLGFLGVSA